MSENYNSYIDKRIEAYYFFFDIISSNIFDFMMKFNFDNGYRIGAIPGFDTIEKTINLISTALKRYDYADAYILLRKVRDASFLGMYILNDIDNNRSKSAEMQVNNILKNFNDIKDPNKMADAFKAFFNCSSKYSINNQEKKNIKKRSENEEGTERMKWIDFYFLIDKLCGKSEKIKFLYENFIKDDIAKISNILNCYVHCLGPKFVEINTDFDKELNIFFDVFDYVIFHIVSFLSLIASRLFKSSDTGDEITLNGTYIEGRQYFIAPGIMPFIVKLKKFNEPLFTYLKENNNNGMIFEVEDCL